MTEGHPPAVTARDRQIDSRFPALSAAGFTSTADDRHEPRDRRPLLDVAHSLGHQVDGSETHCDADDVREPNHSSNDREASHGSRALEENLEPPPIPTLPLAIDSMPLTAPPPLTTVSPSLCHSSTAQSPRLRRSTRVPPNARSERAAPSSIATTEFSDLPSRLDQRRGSLSSLQSARHRAMSHSPPPHATQRLEASGSRTRRHLDPDQHWLSEDEATGSVGGTSGARQRTSGRRRGVQRGFGSDDEGAAGRRKPRLDDILASRIGRTSHEIHHRPSNFGAQDMSSSVDTRIDPASFAAVAPRLVSLLSCPHCHDLLTNPVTFGCGHSRCRECPIVEPSSAATPESPLVTAFAVDTPLPSLANDISQPSAAGKDHITPLASFIPGSFPDPRSTVTPAELPVPISKAAGAPQPPSCGVASCRHAEFSPLPPLFTNGPKTDYNLRKILDHLRTAMSETALVSLVGQTSKSDALGGGSHEPNVDDTSVLDSKEKTVSRMPSDSSGSSGGGVEETKGDGDSKRVHSHKSGHRPVKVAKKTRRLSESAVIDDEMEEEDKKNVDEGQTEPTNSILTDIASTFFADVQAECECQVCVQLLCEPITSPCGHSFCRNCLVRAYDHSSKCPLCRSDLPSLPYFNRERTNLALRSVINTAFPTLAAERAAAIREEELAHLGNVPIFICTTAWPGIPTFLHIFEPRYRLMMRRALESPSREFGMVLPNRDGGGGVNEYGTMLRITNCNVMEDGRSIVHSVGTWRFKIVERWMVDGYNVGRVERVDDVSLEQELELEQTALRSNNDELADYRDPAPLGGAISLTDRPSLPPMTGNMELAIDQLMQICFDFVRTLKAQSSPWVLQRLNNTVGEMPTTPAEFTWWCGEVMPVEDHVKVALLSITSVRERLRLIVFWIEQFRSSWWYSRGCNIM